ncbi:unnamed protein product [Blepharisma stoltei]|uniref:Phosphatidylethanolamine N-methyltransferase n=1 Tax=Blepharisma stoltei TaxID=1481888 RepID=A0AAU9J9D1_9CILI|nr:unnamed protein product [Blepharisma stoltei]
MDLINYNHPTVLHAIGMIALNPVVWNAIAQVEYRSNLISMLFCKRKKIAIIASAILILVLNITRGYCFQEAMNSQPKFETANIFIDFIAWLSILLGQFFVLTSYYKLGFYATFLGDYFGIFIHNEPIVTFPFSICADPMYWGSSLTFFGYALWQRSPIGIMLTAWVAVVYFMAILVETRMLYEIYSKKAQ